MLYHYNMRKPQNKIFKYCIFYSCIFILLYCSIDSPFKVIEPRRGRRGKGWKRRKKEQQRLELLRRQREEEIKREEEQRKKEEEERKREEQRKRAEEERKRIEEEEKRRQEEMKLISGISFRVVT